MRVALVHDYLIQYGGGERVLEEFCKIFPNSPIYTLVYDAASTGHAFEGRDIRTSFLQRLPRVASSYKMLPLLMPSAIEAFDFSEYDLVLSSSASYAKGILMRGDGLHVSYCHTPTRYLWFDYKKTTGDTFYPKLVTKLIPMFMPYLRLWDAQGAHRPDYFVCNSNFVRRKIKKYYNSDAEVIYPPLNFDQFSVSQPKDYFLLVGRLVPYKRADIAVKAFNKLGLPLKIVGTGPEYERLKNMAKSNIHFVGAVSEPDLPQYYSGAQALIFPQEEDFGITPLESMASGRPVIAYKSGGATESIKDESRGVFFAKQTPEQLMEAVEQFRSRQSAGEFDPQHIRDSVKKYSGTNFRQNLVNILNEKLAEDSKIILT